MRYQFKRWHAVAALSAAGVLVLPAVASAQNDAEGDDATAADLVVQHTVVNVGIAQEALANTGWNAQLNGVFQGNFTRQDGLASADGGDADSTSDGSVDDALADALAGFGGDAEATNIADPLNESSGENSQTTGTAVATNAVTSGVTQTQDNTSDNLAEAVGSGSTATAASAVIQVSEADVGVAQYAAANSGFNYQDNTTIQVNVTDQIATGSADGGSGSASSGGEAIADGGDGGSATATNDSISTNSSSGGNSQTTGNATAGNNATINVTQSSSNSSTNTAFSDSGEAP